MSEKEAFQTTIEQQLQEWQSQIDEYSSKLDGLRRKASQLESDVRLQHLEQIKEVEERIEAVNIKIAEGQQRLESIKSGGEEAWEEMKTGSQHAWDDLVKGFNKAWGEIKTSSDLASSRIQDRTKNK
ncbi:MAG: hypothetical protein NPIRA01_00870 [Nitrospirales bacterium]|nr:MAG: hypothetical protein NPIRA01_00870 [Nitrospirales bacterium]